MKNNIQIKINGQFYSSAKEVRDALIKLDKTGDYAAEYAAGERYRLPGREQLMFSSVAEAVAMFNEKKNEALDASRVRVGRKTFESKKDFLDSLSKISAATSAKEFAAGERYVINETYFYRKSEAAAFYDAVFADNLAQLAKQNLIQFA